MATHVIVRVLIVSAAAIGALAVVGCKSPEREPAKVEAAKQGWQSARAPQDLDQLRNRLMHSQSDR